MKVWKIVSEDAVSDPKKTARIFGAILGADYGTSNEIHHFDAASVLLFEDKAAHFVAKRKTDD